MRPYADYAITGDTTLDLLQCEIETDFFGNVFKKMKEVNRKVIIASDKEKKANNRSRSAKLRIAEKLEC